MPTRPLTYKPFAQLDKAIRKAVRTGHGQTIHDGQIEADHKTPMRGFWSGPQKVQDAKAKETPSCETVPLWACVTCNTVSKQHHQKIGDSFPIDTMCSKCRRKKRTVPSNRRRPFVSMEFVMKRYARESVRRIYESHRAAR